MKYLQLVLFTVLFASCVHAQNRKIDSLNRLLINAASDTAHINLLNAKANTYLENDLDSAISITGKTIAWSKRIDYKKGEAKARQIAGVAFTYKGSFQPAFEDYKIAEVLYKQLNDSTELYNIYGGYGMYYGMQSKYDSSIFFYKKAIGFNERTHNKKEVIKAYQNLAVSYTMQSNFLDALNYQNKALQLAESINDTSRMAYINLNMAINYINIHDYTRAEVLLHRAILYAQHAQIKNVELYGYANLATTYKQLNKLNESYDYTMKAVALGRQLGDLPIVATSLSKAGEILALQKKFAGAEQLGKQAIALADTSGSPLNIFQTLTTMGLIKKLQQQYPTAIQYYEKGFAMLKDADLYDEQIGSTYNDLAQSYEHEGMYQKALNAFKIATKISDSISSRDNIREATEMSMNYEFSKKQQAQQLAQQKEEVANKIKLIWLLAVLLVFIALSTITLIAYKREQKAKALIDHQKQRVEHTLEELRTTQTQLIQSEKMASLGELTAGIAHEIQNPVNFVNNFSEVSTELLDEMKEEMNTGNTQEAAAIADEVKQNLQKIIHHGKRADAIVKNMLQHSRKSTGQKELTDINQLADEYLRLSYHGLRAKDKAFNATIQTSFDTSIHAVYIVPQDIGRVLLNLLNNAFYAVNKKSKSLEQTNEQKNYEPTVTVTTKELADHKIEIHVTDNDGGIPKEHLSKIFQPFFTTKPTGEGTGLGLSLSYDIITKGHGGTLTVHSQEGEYAEFIITLPA